MAKSAALGMLEKDHTLRFSRAGGWVRVGGVGRARGRVDGVSRVAPARWFSAWGQGAGKGPLPGRV